MPNDLTAWLIILLVAGVSLSSRLVGSMLMSHIVISAPVRRFLDAASISVIAALIASITAQGGLREASAIALTALIMFRSKTAVWSIVGGMAFAAAWTAVAHA